MWIRAFFVAAAWYDRSVIDAMPRTTAIIQQWDRAGPPDERAISLARPPSVCPSR